MLQQVTDMCSCRMNSASGSKSLILLAAMNSVNSEQGVNRQREQGNPELAAVCSGDVGSPSDREHGVVKSQSFREIRSPESGERQSVA